MWNQLMFKTADDLRIRALEPSATQKLPAANEAKQRLSPRNHCRPILKGAPFIICSGCFKLVQVPADFAASTKTMHKLRCGTAAPVWLSSPLLVGLLDSLLGFTNLTSSRLAAQN